MKGLVLMNSSGEYIVRCLLYGFGLDFPEKIFFFSLEFSQQVRVLNSLGIILDNLLVNYRIEFLQFVHLYFTIL